MSYRIKIDDDNKIALPSEIMQDLFLDSGDELIISLHDGAITIAPAPMARFQKLRGLHREVWDGVDVDEYINQEREAWRK